MSDTAKSEKLRQAIAAKDAERGRPLTDRERLENIAELLAGDADAADTAKSAREIINEEIRFVCAADIPSLGADRLLKKLREAGLEIRPIAPVATPAVEEVSEDDLAEEILVMIAPGMRHRYRDFVKSFIARLKAEGLREAAAIVRDNTEVLRRDGRGWELKAGRPAGDDLGLSFAAAILARADAMEKGEA